MSQDSHDVQYEEYEESWTGRLIVAGVVALALIAGAFFAGKAMAGSSSGPATLAEAVQQAQKGTLPCGDTANAAATPAATPGANGGPLAGGGAFLLRGICNRNGQGAAGGQAGQGQGRGRFGAGGFGGQTVTAVSPDSITVQGPNGSNTIKLDSSTTVSKTSGATVADIKKGDSVIVGGFGGFGGGGANNQNAAARSITILPQAGSN
jgi:hypothetical protein